MLVSSSIWRVISPLLAPSAFCSANSFARSPTIAIRVVLTHRDDSARITIDTSPISPLILSSTCPSEADTLRTGRISRFGY